MSVKIEIEHDGKASNIVVLTAVKNAMQECAWMKKPINNTINTYDHVSCKFTQLIVEETSTKDMLQEGSSCSFRVSVRDAIKNAEGE